MNSRMTRTGEQQPEGLSMRTIIIMMIAIMTMIVNEDKMMMKLIDDSDGTDGNDVK